MCLKGHPFPEKISRGSEVSIIMAFDLTETADELRKYHMLRRTAGLLGLLLIVHIFTVPLYMFLWFLLVAYLLTMDNNLLIQCLLKMCSPPFEFVWLLLLFCLFVFCNSTYINIFVAAHPADATIKHIYAYRLLCPNFV
jgi:hypothetical protein